MNELTNVGPSTQASLDIIKNASLSGELNKLSGAGKAYQSVSQSTAIAIQDATDNLRNINTMATTAMGVAISQMLATGNVQEFTGIIEAANKMVENGTKNFGEVGSSASDLLEKFPSGGS
ncbi:hypothetical protein PRUB_b1125 [Pseudoalteromonas rubra]|uniref:Uncharacterized protein n=1 Tax=Pseudoalteromonas rubra TaxID=43658 RepID=A0A0L0EVP2_9GAMM|nr:MULTISPECIES: hypothetical protein [Pseudoalteromonas]KAF7781794.1 hypothetical protein PRUB_b1125 [Pseudoalteromonas rubra]KNC67923.1 hypothetical protein AC626_07815 [Pseudoalteromonas rubra]MDK1309789.1 hypothetical protein [Pseudoalteromonas sp. R96]